LVDDDAEAMRDLRAMVSPFTEVTVLANARGVTSRAGLADRHVQPTSPKAPPRGPPQSGAGARHDACGGAGCVRGEHERAAKPVVAIERQRRV
jgi:hypothetical protein